MGGGFRLRSADDPALPAAPSPGPNWQVLHAVHAEGFIIVELQHASGDRAEWFFDADGRHSCTIETWSPATRAALAQAFQPALRALCDTFLPSAAPAAPDALVDFAKLGPRLRALIADTVQPAILADPAHVDIDRPSANPPAWPALRETLATSLQQRLTEALRQGALTWPSPLTGAAMFCTGGFSLDDFNALYRFREPATGQDLFLLATEHLARVAGLYCPAENQVLTQGADQSKTLNQHFPRLGPRLLRHLATMADSLLIARRQQGGHHQLAAYLRGGGSAHLGHQLWNELTAIGELAAELPPSHLPHWLVPGDETEFYGPIDALYPALTGRVHRGFPDHATLTRHAYENRFTLIRPTRDRIGADLRRRVMARAEAQAPPPPGNPTFMLGLRVENRTAIDLPGLLAIFIEEAARRHPGCTIILDGHNARGNTRSESTIGSYREDEAAQAPIEVERALAATLRARFTGSDVHIHDTLGDPLATSLAWAGACTGFFALWGAGLAKYRWVANRPGLVVSNRWNLEQKGDLHIYDSPEFTPDPTALTFVSPNAIKDCPDALQLVPFDQPTYSNFDFDPGAIRAEINSFLDTIDRQTACQTAC